LDPYGWAWEFLRRNQGYCQCFEQCQDLVPLCDQQGSGAKFYHLPKPCLFAQTWGLQFLVNPQCHAVETDIFWQDHVVETKLFMNSYADCEGDFDLSQMQCQRAVLIESERELIQLKHGENNITLVSSGASVQAGLLRVSFECQGLSAIKNMARNLNLLHQISRSSFSDVKTDWTNATHRLRDCLIALDGSLKGQSYREIASVLYGKERVDEAWKSPSRSLKDRVRRLVKRGQELMSYDYLSLLS
jgi:hypothetical protein